MGSGKSTTLAACVDYINETFPRHIVTLEDPIEYFFEDKHSFIEQREIGLDTESFDVALRHVTRQDPDVIVIGEMRDAVSFLAGVNAAETGHLVLGTLHSNTTRQAVDRILDFFPLSEREQIRRQLGSIIRAIVCQRLVRTRNGDLVPAVEILRTTETVRKLIENDKLDQLGTAIQTGEQVGMVSFNQSLLKLVENGVIAEEEALAKSTSPEQLRMNFRGVFTSQTGLIS
jgi:twitching motility protein PilT